MIAERDCTYSLYSDWMYKLQTGLSCHRQYKSGTIHVISTDRHSKEWITQVIGDLDQTVIEKCEAACSIELNKDRSTSRRRKEGVKKKGGGCGKLPTEWKIYLDVLSTTELFIC